jgi:rod shape-determining protein MreC
METSRDDVSIAIRSAFLKKGIQQRFSLFVLIMLSIVFIFIETIENKPLNYLRSFIKDTIYRGSLIVSTPTKGFSYLSDKISNHINLKLKYESLVKENNKLKSKISKSDFLVLENSQLKKLIDEGTISKKNVISSRVMLEMKSPYLNSFILNSGNNRGIKNGMAVLNKENFIGRIVDVNFFSSRVLLISDLNSRIPVIIEPSGDHAILNGGGSDESTLKYLAKNNNIKDGDKIYTSGKGGIFSPGIPIGSAKLKNKNIFVSFFSDLDQITFVNIVSRNLEEGK